MGTKEGEMGGHVVGARFTWLPLIPWALVLAFGIAALSVGAVGGH